MPKIPTASILTDESGSGIAKPPSKLLLKRKACPGPKLPIVSTVTVPLFCSSIPFMVSLPKSPAFSPAMTTFAGMLSEVLTVLGAKPLTKAVVVAFAPLLVGRAERISNQTKKH